MAEVFSEDFEDKFDNADLEANGWTLIGTPSYETSDPYEGSRSVSLDANERMRQDIASPLTTAYLQFGFLFDHATSSEFTIVRFGNGSPTSMDLQLRLATDDTVHWEIATGSQVGGDSMALSSGTWYKFGLVVTHSNSISAGELQLYIDDNLEVDVAAGTDTQFFSGGTVDSFELLTTSSSSQNHKSDSIILDDASLPAGTTPDSNAWLSRNRRDRPSARTHHHNPYGLKVLRALGLPADLRHNLLRLPLGQRDARIRELVKRMRGNSNGQVLFNLGTGR